VVLGGYRLSGVWTPAVSHYYLVSLPAVMVAILAGRYINRGMQGPRFLRWVHAGLIATGAVLLVQALRG